MPVDVTAVATMVYSFACKITAGTQKASPQQIPMSMPTADVAWVKWKVPKGPKGTVGFYLASHGQQVLPFASGAANWVIADDDVETWNLQDQMDSGDWQLVGYNTGFYDHTVYVRFGLTPIVAAAPVLTLVPNTALSSLG